jgi:hypothetical protein
MRMGESGPSPFPLSPWQLAHFDSNSSFPKSVFDCARAAVGAQGSPTTIPIAAIKAFIVLIGFIGFPLRICTSMNTKNKQNGFLGHLFGPYP